MLTNEQIKHMVNRFLSWRLPSTFNPDGGVTFDTKYRSPHGPSGTNVFNYNEATEMVKNMLTLLPVAQSPILTDDQKKTLWKMCISAVNTAQDDLETHQRKLAAARKSNHKAEAIQQAYLVSLIGDEITARQLVFDLLMSNGLAARK